MAEKHQSNQRRDEVLLRMLRTPPQPKVVGKADAGIDETKANSPAHGKPLKQQRESSLENDPKKD